jgi:hypothetical protein
MASQEGRIEVISSGPRGKMAMGGFGKKREKGKTAGDGSKKPPPRATEEEEEEDGDIATPKRDRTGEDDQPL